MSPYTKINKIYKSEKVFFSSKDISIILEISVKRTLESTIEKLINSGVLVRIERGKYYLTQKVPSDFDIAQNLLTPSYISLESALNYYGILSQFPFEITSVTSKKTINKTVGEKSFTYAHIKKELMIGYDLISNHLIAKPEKALFDYLYFISKALKTENYLDEMDYTCVDVQKLKVYFALVSISTAKQIDKLINKYL